VRGKLLVTEDGSLATGGFVELVIRAAAQVKASADGTGGMFRRRSSSILLGYTTKRAAEFIK